MSDTITGRPTVMTPETIALLEGAFLNGATDKEAIFIAKISGTTFYDYCKENPDFAERKEALKDMVKYRARQNIVSAIHNGDKPLSQWYLERKAKDEFSARTEQTGKDGKDLIPDIPADVQVLANELNELYKRNKKDIGSNGVSSDTMDKEAQN